MGESVPLVSVIVPLHCKGAYIRETLLSLSAQKYCNWEAIVVENGSSDDGPEIVKTFSDSRIVLEFAPPEVRGPGAARNFGINCARGDWVLFLDADDLLEPSHLESLISVSRRCPFANIIAGGWQQFPDGETSNLTILRPAGECGGLLDTSIASSPWAVHAAIVSRSLVQATQWPEDMDRMLAEDNAFWFSVCLRAQVTYSDSNGALYRTQAVNCRTQSHDVDKWFAGVHAAVQKNLSALQEITGETPNPRQSAALMQLYSGLYRQAIQADNDRIATAAKVEATRWLKCAVAVDNLSPTLLARRLLGVAWTERLKLLLKAR